MATKVKLNWGHVRIWQQLAGFWLSYVALLVLVGWHLKPRIEEVLFVLFVPPLFVVGAWAVVNIASTTLALWLAFLVRGGAQKRRRLSRDGRDEGADAGQARLQDQALAGRRQLPV